MKKTRQNKRVLALLISVIMVMSTILSGCGGSKSSDEYAGYYKTYINASIPTMNFLADATVGALRNYTGLRLYSYMPENRKAVLQGELAAEEPVCMDGEESGSVWQIKLRENAKWENGDKITADDFIFSAQTALDPEQLYVEGAKVASSVVTIKNGVEYIEQYAPGNSPIGWEEVGIQKVDDYTIEITTSHVTTAQKIMQHFSSDPSMLIHEETYEKCWDAAHSVNDYGSTKDKYMSCGAYILTEWVTDSKYVLTRNEDYVRSELIQFPGVVYRVVPDDNTALELFLAGELHNVSLTSAEIDNYLDDPRYMNEVSSQQLNVLINNRNTNYNGILNNLNFRKALFYGTDRESIAKLRNAVPATYILGNKMVVDESGTRFRDLESSQAYLPENYGYDPTYAKECFDAAMQECGLTELTLTVIFSESSPNQRPLAEYIQTSWKDIFGDNFTLELEPKPSSVAYSQRKGWDTNPNSYELAIEGYVPAANVLTAAVAPYTSTYDNANEYNNDEVVDNLYKEAMYGEKALTDNDYLVSLIQQIEQRVLFENYITCPVFEIPNASLLSEEIELPIDERAAVGGWLTLFGSFSEK